MKLFEVIANKPRYRVDQKGQYVPVKPRVRADGKGNFVNPGTGKKVKGNFVNPGTGKKVKAQKPVNPLERRITPPRKSDVVKMPQDVSAPVAKAATAQPAQQQSLPSRPVPDRKSDVISLDADPNSQKIQPNDVVDFSEQPGNDLRNKQIIDKLKANPVDTIKELAKMPSLTRMILKVLGDVLRNTPRINPKQKPRSWSGATKPARQMTKQQLGAFLRKQNITVTEDASYNSVLNAIAEYARTLPRIHLLNLIKTVEDVQQGGEQWRSQLKMAGMNRTDTTDIKAKQGVKNFFSKFKSK